MTRTFAVITVTICLFSQLFAQSIGLKVGTLLDLQVSQFRTQRLEAAFSYPLSYKFEISIATGYYRQHLETLTTANSALPYIAITHHFIPIMAGMKYSFSHDTFVPYLIVEYGKYYDLANKSDLQARYGRFSDDFNSATMFKIGSGMQYSFQERLLFDVSAKYMSDSNFSDGVELMAGLSLPF